MHAQDFDLVLHPDPGAGEKAGAHPVGRGPQAQVDAGRLDLVLGNGSRGKNAFLPDERLDFLVRQDSRRMARQRRPVVLGHVGEEQTHVLSHGDAISARPLVNIRACTRGRGDSAARLVQARRRWRRIGPVCRGKARSHRKNIVMPHRIIRRIYPEWSRINPRGCPQSGGARRPGRLDNTTFSPASTAAGRLPVSGEPWAGAPPATAAPVRASTGLILTEAGCGPRPRASHVATTGSFRLAALGRISVLDVLGRFLDAPVGSRGELEGVIGAMATDGAESAFTRIPADHPRALAHMGAAVGADAPVPKVEKVSHLGRRHVRAPPPVRFP